MGWSDAFMDDYNMWLEEQSGQVCMSQAQQCQPFKEPVTTHEKRIGIVLH